jgi:protein-tyrosine-phosphatase
VSAPGAEEVGTNRAKQLLRGFIPDFLLQEREIARRLGVEAGRQYLRLRFLDTIGVRGQNYRPVPSSARSLLFVCHGNIMRSALAESLTYRVLHECGIEEKMMVISAGIHATAGREAHPWAQDAANELGITLAGHRARPLTHDMVASSDAILAMDYQNKAELSARFPEYREKVYMLGAYAEGAGQYREIADPYHGDLETTRICARQLQVCIRNLIGSLYPDSVPLKETDSMASQQAGSASKNPGPAVIGTNRRQI